MEGERGFVIALENVLSQYATDLLHAYLLVTYVEVLKYNEPVRDCTLESFEVMFLKCYNTDFFGYVFTDLNV